MVQERLPEQGLAQDSELPLLGELEGCVLALAYREQQVVAPPHESLTDVRPTWGTGISSKEKSTNSRTGLQNLQYGQRQ